MTAISNATGEGLMTATGIATGLREHAIARQKNFLAGDCQLK